MAFFGRETYNTQNLPVLVMPGMASFLRSNQPWKQLIESNNIELIQLEPNRPHPLNGNLSLTPIPVPHRDELSETVAFRIAGPDRSLLFMPDIDSWDLLDLSGRSIEEMIAGVDVALLDGTFFDNTELPSERMHAVPHPRILQSVERFGSLPPNERDKIHFIHFNWTNPAVVAGSPQHRRIVDAGFHCAEEGMTLRL
jgi:pyrroloquinoline quinone biosynthesis protein B